MNELAKSNIDKSLNWLKNDVFPLWMVTGVDPENGAFTESLDLKNQPTAAPRRALVQARQIYSFAKGAELNLIDPGRAQRMIVNATDHFILNYLQPDGSCFHAVDLQGKVSQSDKDLYTQAFALFALACAYKVAPNDQYKNKAIKLLQYLQDERKNPSGGFTELKAGKTYYQSNPHMHLFEALLAWMTIDHQPIWQEQAHSVYQLCVDHFFIPESKTLCENFHADWSPLTENQLHYFEPGHHFEWVWLLTWYENLTKIQTYPIREQLYTIATEYGVHPSNHHTVDEVWSNYQIKKSSSRFWPQCERIKAAVVMAKDKQSRHPQKYQIHADQAIEVLFTYLNSPAIGHWQDTKMESGEFTTIDTKASSLYHIINAMDEYIRLR